jgi:dipeptidyl aminopeptidase/acylaminoacyl peptidase
MKIGGLAGSLLLSLSCIATAGFASVAQAAPPAKAFGELPVAFDADISPDGKRLAIILNLSGKYFVATRDTGSGSVVLEGISLGQNAKPRYVKWVNNERYFVSFLKAEEIDGVPFSMGYIYTHDVEKEKGKILVNPRRYFNQFNNVIVNWLENDPENVLMSYPKPSSGRAGGTNIKRDEGQWPGIYKVNVSSGKDKLIQDDRPDVDYWMTDPSGEPRIGQGQDEGGNANLIAINPTTGKWEKADSFPGLEGDTPIYTVLKGGKEIVIGDYNGRDTRGLYIYDLEQKRRTRTVFHNEEFDASGVVISKDGGTVIGAKYVAEEEETELLGAYDTLLTEMRAKYPGFSVRFIDQTDDGQTIIFHLSAPYEPGGLFTYTKGQGEPQMIERIYRGLTSNDMGDVVSVKYTARDGQKIPAFVTLPPTITSSAQLKNIPFIVLPHGGPYGRDEKRFDYFAQFFASRGYGVMQMNFRGSAGYGKSFKEAGRNNWVVMQEDVKDATRYLLSKGYADPDRTCIAGWSYGGYAALMGAAKDNEGLYDCVIAMAALTDIDEAKKDMKDYKGGRAAAKTFFGDSLADREVANANSPVNVADQIKVPVFLAHGDQDQNVRFDQFTKMRRSLQRAGVDGTYLAFEDEDHYLSNQANREAFFEGMEAFLLKVNGPSEYMKK